MDLQEEYFRRKKVPADLIRYVDRANLILRAKNGSGPGKSEWNWLHLTIEVRNENNHPAQYQFVVAANPVIYASPDFSHFSYHHTKVVSEFRWEWDQYESGLADWINKHAKDYVAVPSSEAVFVSWEMFLANYDSWLANFLPYRVIDWLAGSLTGSKEERLNCIQRVETWIAEKYDKVHACWKNIRNNLDQRNYADWLADVVNRISKQAA
jgi:hypothetical protein